MAKLDSTLIDSFVKATKPTPPPKTESFLYGTVQSVDTSVKPSVAYVVFDGSESPTPCEYGVEVKPNDRVTAMIKNRKAVLMANNTNRAVSFDFLNIHNAFFDGKVEFMWTRDAGNEQHVYLGSEDDEAPLHIRCIDAQLGTYLEAGQIELYDQDHNYYAYGHAEGGWYQTSDARLKTDIHDCDPDIARKLRPVAFEFAKDPDKQHYGFIAQEVQEIVPGAVSVGPKEFLVLSYTELIAPILALVQEQEKRIEELERKVRELEGERDQLPADEE